MGRSQACRAIGAILAFLPLLAPASAEAQTMEELFNQLFTFGDCGEPLCLDVELGQHGQHFMPSVVQGENDLLALVTGSVGASLGNLPFASATGGVTFRFVDGAPVASSISPGPIFAERAQTLGERRAVVGINVSGISFASLRGIPLDDLNFTFTHENVGQAAMGDPVYEHDVIEVDLDLSVDLLVTSLFASYGVTQGLDVSVQVPLVRSSLEGRSRAQVVPWAEPTPHYFFGTGGEQSLTAESRASGTSIGLGDIALRMKAALVETETGGFSVVGDVRLPTGDDSDFHGAGAASFRLLGVASHQMGDFSPHANLGFVARGGWNQTNSLLTIIGFDHLLSESATLAVELVGDFQIEDSPLVVPDPVIFTAPTEAAGRRVELTDIPDRADHLLDIGFGLKFEAPRETRVVTSALIPFLKGGARPSFMWSVGLERSF